MDNHPLIHPVAPISDESFRLMIGFLEQLFDLSKEFKAKLRLMLFEITYNKGSNILSAGAKQDIVWFVLNGLIREINVEEHTFAKKTTWFWFAYTFVYAIPGFFDQGTSKVNIKAVTDSKVAFMSYENWKFLKDTFAEMDKLTEKIRSDYKTATKLHAYDNTTLTTADRYLKNEATLIKLFPYIQLKYIAEFMGMATDTLGKLRRRFKN